MEIIKLFFILIIFSEGFVFGFAFPFIGVNQNDNRIRLGRVTTLSSSVDNDFCSMEGDCANIHFSIPMNCQRSWEREWEWLCWTTLDLTNKMNGDDYLLANETIGLKSYNWNTYISVEMENEQHIIHGNREDLREWEYLKIFKRSNNIEGINYIYNNEPVYLYSKQWEKYCGIRKGIFEKQVFCDYTLENATIFYIHNKLFSDFCSYSEKKRSIMTNMIRNIIHEEPNNITINNILNKGYNSTIFSNNIKQFPNLILIVFILVLFL